MAVCIVVFTQIVEFMVSNDRVGEFLSADELEPTPIRQKAPDVGEFKGKKGLNIIF